MEFQVRLNEPAPARVTVDYTTFDGTAKADQDYEARSGTLTFEQGESTQKVGVTLLHDNHDDAGETFGLRLSNARGAYIGRERATGTIDNAGAMPGAWLSRFGRSVSDRTVEAISRRVNEAQQGSHLTLGGGGFARLRVLASDLLNGDESVPDDAEYGAFEDDAVIARLSATDDMFDNETNNDHSRALPMADVSGHSTNGGQVHGMSESQRETPRAGRSVEGGMATHSNARRGMSGSGFEGFARAIGVPEVRDLFRNASFFYAPKTDGIGPDWLGSWSAWGETGSSRFKGQEERVRIDGETSSATLGFDARRGRWLKGVALSYDDGEGAYTSGGIGSGGNVVSSMVGLNPYARYEVSDHTNVWGVFGYGIGGLTLTPERSGEGIETDLSHAMLALGGRTTLSVYADGFANFELALRSDARVQRTDADSVVGLVGTIGATHRVRAVLEGKGALNLSNDGVLTPTLEAGLRRDGGDAETGSGIELGTGIGYSSGRLTVQLNARGLVAHEAASYEEWGISGAVDFTPRIDGTGLRLQLGSTRGVVQSGVDALWRREAAQRNARSAFEAAQRFHAQVGYGIEGRWAGVLWEPFVALESAGHGVNSYRTGVRLIAGERTELNLEVQSQSDIDSGSGYVHDLMITGQTFF